MAFSVKIETEEEQLCPICRRRFTKGRRITTVAYCASYDTVCESCYRYGYADIKNGRNAALLDDTANPLTRLRPAGILEKPMFSSGKAEPERGYEYRMPFVIGHRILRDLLVWLIFCVAAQLALKSCEIGGRADISAVMLELAVFAGSCAFGVKNLCLLLKGIFCGMGHPRRLMLLATLPALALTAYLSFPYRTIGLISAVIHLCS